MQSSRDSCRSLRKTYTAFLQFVSANHWIVGIFAGAPLYYLSSMMIVYHNSNIAPIFMNGSYSFLGTLIGAWLVAAICLWRVWPNGLSVSVFLLKALGYWSLVSFLIVLFYGIRLLPFEFTSYLCAILLPEIAFLLLTADVLRAARSRMYVTLETAATTTATAAATPPDVTTVVTV